MNGWLDLMLAEIARKEQEVREAQEELERREAEEEQRDQAK